MSRVRDLARGAIFPVVVLSLVAGAYALSVNRQRVQVAYWLWKLRGGAEPEAVGTELLRLDADQVRTGLVGELNHPDAEVRRRVAPLAIDLLEREEIDPLILGVRGFQEAVISGRHSGPGLWEEVLLALPENDQAILLLDEPPEAIEHLLDLLTHASKPVDRRRAADALSWATRTDPVVSAALLERARLDQDPIVRFACFKSLLRLSSAPLPTEVQALCRELIAYPDPDVRSAAAIALARSGSVTDLETTFVELLREARPDSDDHYRILSGAGSLPPTDRLADVVFSLDLDSPFEATPSWEPHCQKALVAAEAARDNGQFLPPLLATLARAAPAAALEILPRRAIWGLGGPRWRVLEELRKNPRQAAGFLVESPRRGELSKALSELLAQLAANPESALPATGGIPDERRIWVTLLAETAIDMLVWCGDPNALTALESYAAVATRPWQRDSQRRSRYGAAMLKGKLPEALARRAQVSIVFLRQHLGPDGRAGGQYVHEPESGCYLQGNGIPYLEHRTALACLALMDEPDAPELLAKSVKWLTGPAQDELGWTKGQNDPKFPNHQLAPTIAFGSIPGALEETLWVWALARAVERGVEGEAARAALSRRLLQLEDTRREKGSLVLALAATGTVIPEARARARALRRQERLLGDSSLTTFAARALLGPDDDFPALAPTLQIQDGDPWLSTLGLKGPGVDPLTRRVLLWELIDTLEIDTHPEKLQTGPGSPCGGGILRNGNEDPVVLTAWYVLAFKALADALEE